MIARFYRIFAVSCVTALYACAGADETTASDGRVDGAAPGSELAGEATADVLSLDEQIAVIEQRLDATNTHDWDRQLTLLLLQLGLVSL